jgi:6-phosphofructokinase 1
MMGKERGKTSEIIAFAEGAGSSTEFAKKLEDGTGFEVRVSILGYIQRGGRPTARTRILASKFGEEAVKLLHEGRSNLLVCLDQGRICSKPIEDVIGKEKQFNIHQYKLIETLAI